MMSDRARRKEVTGTGGDKAKLVDLAKAWHVPFLSQVLLYGIVVAVQQLRHRCGLGTGAVCTGHTVYLAVHLDWTRAPVERTVF